MSWDRNLEEETLRMLVGHDRIESLVDRRDTTVPETFVPSARRFAIASNMHLLLLAHPMAHLGMLGGWVGGKREGLYTAVTRDCFLYIRRYEGRAGSPDIWGIERLRVCEKTPNEVLAFGYGPTPVFHRDPKMAKAIAKRCHPYPREEAKLLRWIPITGEAAANSENESRSEEKRYGMAN